MPTILITGAASGLGEAFLNAFISDPSNLILTLDRISLPSSYRAFGRVIHREVDITSESELATWSSIYLRERAIDLAIHCAGIRGLVPEVEKEHPEDVPACETITVMDSATMKRAFDINALGTFNLFRTILPSLILAARSSPERPPKVIIMSSRMGSIASNRGGGAYAYRASKAALNAIVKSFSIDIPDVTWVLVHPGRVETKLVKCREQGAISAEESIEEMMKLIANLVKGDSGKFCDRLGKEISW